MPLGLSEWAEIAAIVSAMCDVVTTGHNTFQTFYKHRINEPGVRHRAAILRNALSSTYSVEEVKAISERLASCKRQFIAEGSGQQRRRCLCNVLRDVRDGNGGTIPFPEWEQTYAKLGCETLRGS